MQKNDHLWSLVLAGGEGERTRPFIQRWLGFHMPKQYCRFVGTRSMFQHTIDRADLIAPGSRRVAVIARAHHAEAQKQMKGREDGKLVLQPENRGTAAGVFLPLAYIRAADPDATVVIYPSDHFVSPQEDFAATVQNAVSAAELAPEKVILLGAVPAGAEQDYGWILPQREGSAPATGPQPVRCFLEKPDRDTARAAYEAGGLWNTFILAARAELLWKLGNALMPQITDRIARIQEAIGTSRELQAIDEEYEAMPVRNFSSHLLEQAPESLSVMQLGDVDWSDWGRPERIAETLRRIGKQPLFPEALMAA